MIYIQANESGDLPYNFECASALYGAFDEDQFIKLVQFGSIKNGEYDLIFKENLFCGSVEFMSEVWKRSGRSPTIPRNSNRSERVWPLSEAIELIARGQSLFIKPVQNKLFTGAVFDGVSISYLKDISPNTSIIIAEQFRSRIVSEWRCYVRFNQILGIKNYSGDPWVLPDKEFVKSILNENSDFPDAYCADFGVLESGESVVIEFNDGWATGNYGLDNSDYYKYLRTRYFQIMRTI